jgi:hypothetical protein
MPFDPAKIQALCGWRPDWQQIAKTAASLPPFRTTAAHLMQAPPHTASSGLLWEDVAAVRGSMIPAHEQSIGSCVGHGWSVALDILQCCDIRRRGKQQTFRSTSHAGVYALSREHAGLLGRGDGSYGAAAAFTTQHWGDVSDQDCGDSDSDDSLAAAWGRRGMPADMKRLAAPHVARQMSTCTTAAEAAAALQDGRPVPVCSDVAFVMTRDAQGYCRRDMSNTWPHCMVFIAFDPATRRFCVLQSWGPNVPNGPTYLGQPNNSFWIDWDVAEVMLRQGDSFVPGDYQGWSDQPTPPPPPPGPTPIGPCMRLGCGLEPGVYAIVRRNPGCFPKVFCELTANDPLPGGTYCHSSGLRSGEEFSPPKGTVATIDVSAVQRYLGDLVTRLFPAS